MRRETGLRMCLSFINRAAQVSRTRASITKTRTEFIFFYNPCYFQAGNALECQCWGHPYSFNAYNCSLYKEKNTMLASRHLHNTRNLYPLTMMFWGLFLPFLPMKTFITWRAGTACLQLHSEAWKWVKTYVSKYSFKYTITKSQTEMICSMAGLKFLNGNINRW